MVGACTIIHLCCGSSVMFACYNSGREISSGVLLCGGRPCLTFASTCCRLPLPTAMKVLAAIAALLLVAYVTGEQVELLAGWFSRSVGGRLFRELSGRTLLVMVPSGPGMPWRARLCCRVFILCNFILY